MTDNAINSEQTSLIFQNSSRERLIHSCKVPPLRVSSSHESVKRRTHAVTPRDPLHGSSGPALSRRETCLHTRDHHNWIHHWQEHCFPQSRCCLTFNTILHYLHYYFFLSFSSVWICRMDHAAARWIVHMLLADQMTLPWTNKNILNGHKVWSDHLESWAYQWTDLIFIS